MPSTWNRAKEDWIGTFTFRTTVSRSNKKNINYKSAGKRYKEGVSGDLSMLKGKNVTFEQVTDFFKGFSGKNFSYDYLRSDLTTMIDIINLCANRSSLREELHKLTEKFLIEKEDKLKSEPRVKSIW
jgi:hypothetical protein